jgi:hypothetical protein
MKTTKLNLRSIRMIRMNKALALRGGAAISGLGVYVKSFTGPASGSFPVGR